MVDSVWIHLWCPSDAYLSVRLVVTKCSQMPHEKAKNGAVVSREATQLLLTCLFLVSRSVSHAGSAGTFCSFGVHSHGFTRVVFVGCCLLLARPHGWYILRYLQVQRGESTE